MPETTIPRPIAHVLGWPVLDVVARLALSSPFVVSGISKLLDFSSAAAEVSALGLQQPSLIAAATIVTQLGGSLLLLTRRYCWLGAGVLAVFTLLATLLAHPFWTFEGSDLVRQMNTFLEHLAIIGGFVMAALFVNGRKLRP